MKRCVNAWTLGLASGLLAGLGAFVFLEGLDTATAAREVRPWLLWCLPVVGLIWGALHQRLSAYDSVAHATGGTSIVITEARRPDRGISPWQAPLVLVGTWAAHLTGASVGREGVGLQLSASLSEHVARWWRLNRDQRRVLLVGAVAGGFGAVFGVPWAGAVFALEVVGRPRRRPAFIVVALIASFTGDQVVTRLGHGHTSWPSLRPGTDVALAARLVALGAVMAAAAWCFVTAVEHLRSLGSRLLRIGALRPAMGGVATVALALLWGREYLGLSLPLLEAAVAGSTTVWTVPLLKAVFTVVALASGFPGGEVTPLFVVGASLGAVLAPPLGMDPSVAAAVGMVALFAAASGAPLASALMAAELFGGGMAGYALVACGVAAMLNRRRRVYPADGRGHQVLSTRMGNWRGPRI